MSQPPIPPEPPRRRRTRRQRWVLALVIIPVAAVLGALLIASLIGLWLYINHDRPELIDDPQVVSTTESACSTMTQAVQQAAPPLNATNATKPRAIQEQNDAVAAMIRTIRLLGSDRLDNDRPTPSWLEDWQTIIDQRARYARNLASNRPTPFAIPTAEGRPIIERMNDVGISCTVPPELTNLR